MLQMMRKNGQVLVLENGQVCDFLSILRPATILGKRHALIRERERKCRTYSSRYHTYSSRHSAGGLPVRRKVETRSGGTRGGSG